MKKKLVTADVPVGDVWSITSHILELCTKVYQLENSVTKQNININELVTSCNKAMYELANKCTTLEGRISELESILVAKERASSTEASLRVVKKPDVQH